MNHDEDEKRTNIPDAVKFLLREEVGFGCPVEGCGTPYLEYHHFDPPVKVRPHNEPAGMIALCPTHHKKADGGSYTNEKLHAYKKDKFNTANIKSSLDWLRNKLLTIVGGNYYFEVSKILTIDNYEVIALHRDKGGDLRLNVNMLSLLPEERLVIESHSWERCGAPEDLRCPPQGKELEIRYKNGDYLYLKFLVLDSLEMAEKRYGTKILQHIAEHFPLTALEINMKIAGANIDLSPKQSNIRGAYMKGCLFTDDSRINLTTGIKWRQNESRSTP